ncbi:HAD family hydrolase [Maliponia aquimaris]|uniref:Alpha-D-glucose-1-phosphate phosphatase YihX n=1 Tax=Maliponia aquimaris TaxID=1673631 RepID=A0A238K988_9RHOB|nr:HAD family phosphatase [Maliponia aquimaris]SMX39470.1 Alpha-D-glucose-1-phosphate phosphatase YihX [Maliponia aquimaris]
MTIEAVIFDIGNVLIEWQPERYYDAKIGEARRRAMFAALDLHGMNDLIDRGGDFRQTVYDWADRNPEWAAEIRLWHDDWLEMATPAIPHSVRLLRALRGNGHKVHALTNFGIGTWAIATPRYDFLNEFDHAFVSGHLGVTKPDPQIYQMVEDHLGLPAAALLFADDRADNLATAAARGWHTHLFTGPQCWANRLVTEGLLTEEQAR